MLHGNQGALKSTFLKVLAYGDVPGRERWFADTKLDLSNKDGFQQLRGVWIYEWSELDALSNARSIESVKAFMSASADTYRPSFGRTVLRVERCCVFGGSTNKEDFLSDGTGNRRFWPITTGARVDLGWLQHNRDQLWAEAMVEYRAGEPHYLSQDEVEALKQVHERHTQDHPWMSLIEEWLTRATEGGGWKPSTADILVGAIQKPTGQWTRSDEMTVATCMTRLGWKKGGKVLESGLRVRRWSKEEP